MSDERWVIATLYKDDYLGLCGRSTREKASAVMDEDIRAGRRVITLPQSVAWAALQEASDDLPIEDVRAELDARGIDIKPAIEKVRVALRTAERCERLEGALRLVLPLAKGYSAAHPCESNSRYVAVADAALATEPVPRALDFFLGRGEVAIGPATCGDKRAVFVQDVVTRGDVGKDCDLANHAPRGVNLVIHDPAGARVLIEELEKAIAASRPVLMCNAELCTSTVGPMDAMSFGECECSCHTVFNYCPLSPKASAS